LDTPSYVEAIKTSVSSYRHVTYWTPDVKWLLGTLSLVLKRAKRESDHSSPSSAAIYLHTPMPRVPKW